MAVLGGVEGFDQPPHGAEATAVECVGKQTQLARGLVVADGFGHAVTSVAASRHVRARQGSGVHARIIARGGRICPPMKPFSRLREKGCFRSEEHTSELQSLMRISYAVFCLKKKIKKIRRNKHIRLTI